MAQLKISFRLLTFYRQLPYPVNISETMGTVCTLMYEPLRMSRLCSVSVTFMDFSLFVNLKYLQ